jgi:hypothetical protein
MICNAVIHIIKHFSVGGIQITMYEAVQQMFENGQRSGIA